jgi:hypothetical protein
MGTFHRYSNEDGGYVRVKLSGYYALQTNPQSTDFLGNQLGLSGGDSVPRTVEKAFTITKDLHAKADGPAQEELLDRLPTLSRHRCQLSVSDRRKLKAFLKENSPRYADEVRQELNQFLDEETPIQLIEWSEIDESQLGVDPSENALHSIAESVTESEH